MSIRTIVFLPGTWLPESTYTSFLQALEKAGYPVCYVSYPYCDFASADCQQDATAIRDQAIRPLVEKQGKDIVVFMHSYASMSGGSAARGFSKTCRQRNGQAGGIISLICIGALLVPEGLSCAGL
jgi:DNA-binding LacI/PurR family transcriptional regulator